MLVGAVRKACKCSDRMSEPRLCGGAVLKRSGGAWRCVVVVEVRAWACSDGEVEAVLRLEAIVRSALDGSK